MNTFFAFVGSRGEILLPAELRDLLRLEEGSTVKLRLEVDGLVCTREGECTVGPLADFFEDLVLGDLNSAGYQGNEIKDRAYQEKIRLSNALDRLSEEARISNIQGKEREWRKFKELSNYALIDQGDFKVVVAARAESDLERLSAALQQEVANIMIALEKNPSEFKRLRGPYYATYRVSFSGKNSGQFRVIYSLFEGNNTVSILSIGERKEIYNMLKNLI